MSSEFRLALPPYRPGAKEEGFWNTAPFSQIDWEMHPDDYLKVVPEGETIRRSSSEHGWPWSHLCERIGRGEPIDPPRLVLDTKCMVIGHEGRHRAAAALKCGLNKMPVILTCAKEQNGRYRPAGAAPCLKCLRRPLKPQDEWTTQQSIYDIHRRGRRRRKTGFQDWGRMGSGGISD